MTNPAHSRLAATSRGQADAAPPLGASVYFLRVVINKHFLASGQTKGQWRQQRQPHGTMHAHWQVRSRKPTSSKTAPPSSLPGTGTSLQVPSPHETCRRSFLQHTLNLQRCKQHTLDLQCTRLSCTLPTGTAHEQFQPLAGDPATTSRCRAAQQPGSNGGDCAGPLQEKGTERSARSTRRVRGGNNKGRSGARIAGTKGGKRGGNGVRGRQCAGTRRE